MKTIVTALDFSDASEKVLSAAIAMAQAQGASLHLVHVLEPTPSYTAYGMTPEEFPAIQVFQQESQSRAEIRLQEAKKTALATISDVHTELMIGSPLHSIAEYLHQKNADLVVIGSHGHGAITALLIGSVAEGLVRKAICPTLVIPCAAP
ncbi:MAG: hypothetical protein RLZZ224_1219 [Verrucomicrobiota bacterium]|jgi:nucleotide-binding universal stress UspA family protein